VWPFRSLATQMEIETGSTAPEPAPAPAPEVEVEEEIDTTGLSKKEIYKLKLKKIAKKAEDRERQANIEAEERAQREAEEEEEQRRLGLSKAERRHINKARDEFNQDESLREGERSPSRNADEDGEGGSRSSSPQNARAAQEAPKSMASILAQLSSPKLFASALSGKAAVVLTKEDRALALRQDRELIAEILAKAERERVCANLQQYKSSPPPSYSPRSPREGISGCTSFDQLKHSLYYRRSLPRHFSPRFGSPQRPGSAMDSSPSAIPLQYHSAQFDEIIQSVTPPASGCRAPHRSSSPGRKGRRTKAKTKPQRPKSLGSFS